MIIAHAGKDCRDRQLRSDMVKWLGNSLKLLKQRGIIRKKHTGGGIVWEPGSDLTC
jgi:hypothetical protein